MNAWSAVIGAAVTGLLALASVMYTRRGQNVTDSGELALEIAKEARTEVKELRVELAWRDGALAAYSDHVDHMWEWVTNGQPPPPPPRRPLLPPRTGPSEMTW